MTVHREGSSYRLMLPGALDPVGPVEVPPDPPEVLAPGVAGLVGPVELPAEPPELLRPKPGDVLPAAPGAPVGAPTAPPLVPWAYIGAASATTSKNAPRILADLKSICGPVYWLQALTRAPKTLFRAFPS